MGEIDESCTKCVFDRLPPEMIRFIFRKQSTDDLLQASSITGRLHRVAQHHMYLSEGALLMRGGQDTAETVEREFDVSNVASLYLVDVFDFDVDVPREFRSRRDGGKADDGQDAGGVRPPAVLEVLHVGYGKNANYGDLADGGLRRLLSRVPAKRVCFSNVPMTADDVADVVSAALEAGAGHWPLVLRCSYDRADDERLLSLVDAVECTCAGLLAEFRVTVRRPAPRSYAVYPTSCSGASAEDDDDDDDADRRAAAVEAAAAVAAEMPEDLLALTATDCSGLGAAAYKRLVTACRQLRKLSMRAARQADDDGFEAVAGMPALQHLDMDGMVDVTSDGLLNGLRRADALQSLGLSDCPYVTDDVLRRVGELRHLHRLRLDLTECDKTTATGVLDMLAGCERLRELELTVPLSADHVDAVAGAARLPGLRTFRLTFERLSFQEHLDNQPADADWQLALAALFRDRVDFRMRQTFTKIAVSVD